jgi:hypothetical protein
MLCPSCLTSVKAAYLSLDLALSTNMGHGSTNILHDSLHSLCLSVEEGCWICLQLWASMLEYAKCVNESGGDFSEQDGNFLEHEDGFEVEFKIIKKWRKNGNSSIQLNMSSRNNTLYLALQTTSFPGLQFILQPESINEAGSDASIGPALASGTASMVGNPGLWSHWFRTCSESHEKCREMDCKLPPFVPDRLVEIFTDDGGSSFTWRLVCRTDVGNVQYLTLSHCWGSSRHTSLKSENHSAFLERSTCSGLPKSFQHAFHITFLLNFRFIWIDSLCIVQDNPEDWKAQASMMGSVYKNACCNIAATWAANGNDGCFMEKESRIITLDFGLDHSTRYHIVPEMLYYTDLMEAPLNTRGWVTQERFLARKQLSFAKSQVYWECRELVASEQFPKGILGRLRDLSPYNQTRPPTGKPTLDLETGADRRDAWTALVDFYSNCKFTRLSDKMIALAGLAENMRNATEDIYLAGLWKKDLQKQLRWVTDCDVRKQLNRFKSPTYLAPTWSWASVNGPVMSDKRYCAVNEKFPSCIEILVASVHSEHPSELHSFVASRLVLRGIAVWARASRAGKSTRHDDDDDWELQSTGRDEISHSVITKSTHVSIMWDENMSGPNVSPERWPSFLEERNSNLLCMFLFIEKSYVDGLLLRRLPEGSNGDAYVRMGVFSNYDGSFLTLLSTGLKIPSGHPIVEDINLDDAGIADLVHTVTVI